MNAQDFRKLLNEELDGEITPERRRLLIAELKDSPERLREYRQQKHFARAMRDWDSARRPSWREILRDTFRAFSPFRLCRVGALSLNATILFFATVSFQFRGPQASDFSPTATPAAVGAQESIPAAQNSSEDISSNSANDSDSSEALSLLTEEYAFVRL
jgi:hypothetical protein